MVSKGDQLVSNHRHPLVSLLLSGPDAPLLVMADVRSCPSPATELNSTGLSGCQGLLGTLLGAKRTSDTRPKRVRL